MAVGGSEVDEEKTICSHVQQMKKIAHASRKLEDSEKDCQAARGREKRYHSKIYVCRSSKY